MKVVRHFQGYILAVAVMVSVFVGASVFNAPTASAVYFGTIYKQFVPPTPTCPAHFITYNLLTHQVIGLLLQVPTFLNYDPFADFSLGEYESTPVPCYPFPGYFIYPQIMMGTS